MAVGRIATGITDPVKRSLKFRDRESVWGHGTGETVSQRRALLENRAIASDHDQLKD